MPLSDALLGGCFPSNRLMLLRKRQMLRSFHHWQLPHCEGVRVYRKRHEHCVIGRSTLAHAPKTEGLTSS